MRNKKFMLHVPYYALEPERMERCFAQQAAQGWQLDYVGPLWYQFVRGEAYCYRVQVVEESKQDDYAAALSELGVETVNALGSLLILRKREDGAPFALFSDLDSEIAHAKKCRRSLLWGSFFCLWMTAFLLWQLMGVLPGGSLLADYAPWLVLGLAVLALYAVGALRAVHALRRSQKRIKALQVERTIRE